MTNLIVASTSTVYGSEYLEYLLPILANHFQTVEKILFIPYAKAGGISYEAYTEKVAFAFKAINKKVIGIHEYEEPKKAIEQAEAIFVGGGNTFLLVRELYKKDLFTILKKQLEKGIPYLGCSAGSNIIGLTMGTTNDMPIVEVPSYKTLGIIPFNINPHFLDTPADSKHKGETREERIYEFHKINNQPVIGLREGSWLRVKNNKITLEGNLTAKWFEKDKQPVEIEVGEIKI